jgi:energy-coupling factor transporter ATP-binding protein EcfA2
MKLRRLEIHNFKGIKYLPLSFEDYKNEPRFLTCLVGDNGSGKTTVLQAIALVLSLATRKTPDIYSFRWNGFLPERMGTFGSTEIKLELELHPEELRWMKMIYTETQKRGSDTAPISLPDFSKPGLTLIYDGRDLTSDEGLSGLMKLGGRFLLKDFFALAMTTQPPRLGEVFWFDQFRIIGSGLLESEHHYDAQQRKSAYSMAPLETSWNTAITSLRELLVGWWTLHTSEGRKGRDLIAELEPRLEDVFPGTRFIGVELRPGVVSPTQKDFYFRLKRGDLEYDISEMSSGEQAVFEILYEFVRLNIARSVVLIDELELHLHPPQQQAMLASLRKLGPDCQFIITTHSPYLEDAIPEEEIVRLGGGVVC